MLRSGVEVTFGADRGPLNPNLDVPTMDEVMSAIESFPLDSGWEEVQARVLPVFPRARPSTLDMPEMLTTVVEAGVTIGYGIDLGRVFARVSREMVARWGISADALREAAMANLHCEARTIGPADVMREPSDDGYVISAIQPAGGWGSTLVLLPDELARVFGSHSQVFIAPLRAVLLSFPAYVDRRTVAFFAEEFEALDPTHLCLEGFVLRDGRVSIEALPRRGPFHPAAANVSRVGHTA
jgi:hypothetical protein